MKQFLKMIFSIFLSIIFLVSISSCSKSKHLEKEGYVFVEAEGWYEKEGESRNEIIVNLTQSDATLQKSYGINSNIEKIVFIGHPQVIYNDFNIVVNSRSNNLYIEFQNFNYKAGTEKIGLDASNVIGEQKVYLIINGVSSINGGKGKNGNSGVSYNYNSAREDSTANHGGNGEDGNSGCDAISANNLYISVNENAKLTLIGGVGGNGGNGGNGEGSKFRDRGHAGDGGNGGSGGAGGCAIRIKNSLSIENNGDCVLFGGQAGNGGIGGRGGENKDTEYMEIADHGGNGGNGGNGGIGGTTIYASSYNTEVRVTGNTVVVKSGDGGNGGNGGQGGSSCKCDRPLIGPFDYGDGGTPGTGGNGGHGGNTNVVFVNCQVQSIIENSNGGDGGIGGKGGYSPVTGYNSDGKNG